MIVLIGIRIILSENKSKNERTIIHCTVETRAPPKKQKPGREGMYFITVVCKY